MADDTITLVSTSDTPEQVLEALTGKSAEAPPEKPAETPAGETPAETPPAEDKPAPEAGAAETAETPEQKETREASEAGGRLAKRRVSIQSEIDELTRNKYNVRRDVEAEEARLAELRRERERLETEVAKPSAKAAPDAPPESSERDEPKVNAVDDQGNAKYATYEDYLSDHAKWTREQAEAAAKRVIAETQKAERERIDRESASRAANEHVVQYQTKLDEFKKTHADFDAVYEDAKDSAQAIRIALGPEAFRTIDGYAVFDAENGPALMYHLLKNPDEAKAIAIKAPPQQIIHLARLEERLRQEGASKTPARPPAAPETKAPEPIKPVGSSPTATTVSPDEESFQDYKARRERELRAKRSA